MAVAPGTLTFTLLGEIDPPRRPELVPIDNLTDALRAVRDGTVAGAAGNGLALRAAARDLAMGELVEVPLRSVPYALATAKGRGPQFSWVGEALNRLHQTGRFNHLVEQHLVISPVRRTWRDFAVPLGLVLAAVVAAGGASVVWNRALRRQVQARTRDLAQSLAEKERLAASLQEREQQLEEAQRIAAIESEREQLRSIVSHAPVAMAILDRDLRYVAYSDRWLKYWRLRGRPLLGRRHDELFPALPAAYHQALQQALDGKVVTRREDPFALGDGS